MKLPLTLALDPHHHQDTSDDDNKQSARCFADPPTILKDERSGELFIIELQGQLELEEDGDADDHSTRSHAGQKIGKLDMSIPTRPTLLIGHHRLIGQIVKLNTPLAILKHTLPPKAAAPSSSIPRPPPTSSPLHPRLNGHPPTTTLLDGSDNIPSSPLKRQRSSSPVDHLNGDEEDSNPAKRLQTGNPSTSTDGNNLATPLPARLSTKTTGNVEPSSPFLAVPPSSALTNRTAAPSTPLNVSELKLGKHEILGILKSKIIFSKRPEPVVKLDEESEDE